MVRQQIANLNNAGSRPVTYSIIIFNIINIIMTNTKVYQLIEDCSPYYVRFNHDGISDIVRICQEELLKISIKTPFTPHVLSYKVSKLILSYVPFAHLNFLQDRLSLFISKPGYRHFVHKDGLNTSVGVNYGINILDDDCSTNWYSDETCEKYKDKISANLPYNRARILTEDFKKENEVPLKTTIAQQSECMIFNTEIFHDWDNSQSKNTRVILKLRLAEEDGFSVEDMKKILFPEL